jgi:hypothetical protein
MDATEQAIDQTMRITLTGVEYVLRFSGAGTKNLASALWSVASTQQKTKGKARLESLLKSGKELKVFNIHQGELSTFAKEAKRYGVLYAVIKGVGDDPGALVDVMVKAEDAAKINRIVERLEYGRFDETEVVVDAEREIASKGMDAVEKPETQKDTNELIDEMLSNPPKKEGEPAKNPTAAKTESPVPSEPSSKKDGHPHSRTTAEVKTDKPEARTSRSKTREGSGFDDGRERRSVKEQIEEKRASRTEISKQKPKPEQTLHQNPQKTGRSRPRHKTEKGR